MENSTRIEFLGCPLDLITTKELLANFSATIDSSECFHVLQFTNANKIAQVHCDQKMKDIMSNADYVLTDGMPLVYMAKILGIRIPERIDGIGLMAKLIEFAEKKNLSVYLLGATQEVLDNCIKKIREKHPSLKIAGSRNGYFNSDQTLTIVNEIADVKPHILFLGMGSPYKEQFAHNYKNMLRVPIIQGVGGSFDVIAGMVKRAPKWVQQIGLEWMFRVIQEPKRMAWRYAKTNAICLSLFLKAFSVSKFKNTKNIPM